ncbi:MAG: RNA polymerase sigma factor [Vicinamibacteria bacterium]
MEPAGADSERANDAVELLRRHGEVLRRVARRHSLCPDDADDALQRASVILLTKAPPIDPGRLIAWMVVVTKHEAMAVRRGRERLLACLAPVGAPADRLDGLASDHPDPVERVERSERLAEACAALAALKANERLAIVLQAEGYSYAEICEICGWSYTKVNRCLAEGRARLYRLAEASGLRS